MKKSTNPKNFINQIIYHKKNDTYYQISQLPKKYSKKSTTHSGEYYTRVIRLNNNDGKTRNTTVLHINPNNVDNIRIVKDLHINNDGSFNVTFDDALTNDFRKYIERKHYGILKLIFKKIMKIFKKNKN